MDIHGKTKGTALEKMIAQLASGEAMGGGMYYSLAHGADKSLFYHGDWIKKPGVTIVSCNDGLRPVIMNLEATDEESKIDYTPVEGDEP